MESIFSMLQNGAGLRMSSFFLALLALTFGVACGQSVDVNLSYDHSGAEIGDTVEMDVVAEASSPVSGFTVTLAVDSDKYDFSNMTYQVLDSWLGTPSEIQASASVSGDDLTISLQRTDNATRTGAGTVMRLGGVVIINDIHSKRNGIQDNEWHVTLPGMKVGPNPTDGHLSLVGWKDGVRSVELVSAQGQVHPLPRQAQQNLCQFEAGKYWLRVKENDQRVQNLPIQILR